MFGLSEIKCLCDQILSNCKTIQSRIFTILTRLANMAEKGDHQMALVKDVQAAVVALQASVDALKGRLADVILPADLDPVVAAVSAAQAEVDGLVPAPAAPAAPVEAPPAEPAQ